MVKILATWSHNKGIYAEIIIITFVFETMAIYLQEKVKIAEKMIITKTQGDLSILFDTQSRERTSD
jgi:hypothetical protein